MRISGGEYAENRVKTWKRHQAKSANKKTPGTYNEMQIKTRRNALIASSLVAGIILSVILGFVILLMTAVAHM